uniref:Uncharacterized protein n=1 Tax=Aegilops tauschii subsp. strangulata TaxID=200361 RepID=A0A453GMR5_AEGTS
CRRTRVEKGGARPPPSPPAIANAPSLPLPDACGGNADSSPSPEEARCWRRRSRCRSLMRTRLYFKPRRAPQVSLGGR